MVRLDIGDVVLRRMQEKDIEAVKALIKVRFNISLMSYVYLRSLSLQKCHAWRSCYLAISKNLEDRNEVNEVHYTCQH